MPGILYVVATPIGNLEDITFRAVRILREVAVIAAEDTRRTARLLQHYSISTPTTSLHEHNEHARVPGLMARLAAGDAVAIVSDAGTPLVSDPGRLLVAAAHAGGIRVEPIPGPNAAMALLSAAGLPADEVVFLGFPPARSSARKRWVDRLAGEQRLLVLYETPHRIRETLADLQAALGDRVVAVGRELTKVHEDLVVLPISAHRERLSDAVKGEFVLAVSPDAATPGRPEPLDPHNVADEFGRMTDSGVISRRDAIRQLASRYGVPTREIYKHIRDSDN